MTGVDWGELLVILATAGVVVPLFGRLRFGIIPGFIIAGAILGPGGLGQLVPDHPWLGAITFSDPERVAPLAELGVVFLLFVIGLEFSFDRLWSMRRMVVGLGGLQFVLSAALIMLVAWLFGASLSAALVVGLALALSSTAIVTQVLIGAHRFARPVGRATLGVLLFQDLMVVPIVIILGLLGGEEVVLSAAVLRAVGLAVATLVGILLAGRYVMRPLLRLAGGTGSRELVVAIALFLAIGTALLTASVGLSPALGAFLAGLLLAESEYRHQVEVDIDPFKGLLLGLFFMTVGMSLNLAALTVGPVIFVAALAGLIVCKVLVAVAVGRAMGLALPVAIEAGLVLAGAGEFAFVVFSLASEEQILDRSALQFFVALAALSMFLIPALGTLGRWFAERLEGRRAVHEHGVEDGEAEGFTDHVVIGGFGRVGRTVAGLLDAEGVAYVALDLDAELCARERRARRPIFFGDCSRGEILKKVGGDHARAFVVTTDEPEASEEMVRAIYAAWPGAIVHARAKDSAHAARLVRLGVAGAVPEALEGSLQLAGQVLIGIGLPDEAVDARLEVARLAAIRRIGQAES